MVYPPLVLKNAQNTVNYISSLSLIRLIHIYIYNQIRFCILYQEWFSNYSCCHSFVHSNNSQVQAYFPPSADEFKSKSFFLVSKSVDVSFYKPLSSAGRWKRLPENSQCCAGTAGNRRSMQLLKVQCHVKSQFMMTQASIVLPLPFLL